MRNLFPNLTVAEYFAGIGLVRMGLEPIGWRMVWANDISAKKYEMYKDFFPDADNHYIVKDIFKVDPASVPSTTLATCSFPCIDLSLAGNMNGMGGKHSSVFWGFINILKAQGKLTPPLVLVENVPGWLYSNKGADFRVTIQSLNELGYQCDVFTLDALRFTPQSRLRIFLVGAKFQIDNKHSEFILSRPRSLLSESLRECIFAHWNLDWFYNDIPAPPPLHTSGLSEIVEPMSDSDERWWGDNEVNRHLEMMEQSHYERVVQLVQKDQITYRTFFRRRRKGQQRAEVRSDNLSGCLRTAVGGSGKQFLIRAGKGAIKMRTMTPREYARLQGVPDRYPITVNGVKALTGFGDAVCVPAITWIARNVLNPLVEKIEEQNTPSYQRGN
ncbi:DNA (cytosine-5-)-methyltransferase [Candidatus Poribacteria bacterium]|nr:DNA (cytosine-5-)-methyltransferase [Candidatus Poribacteria bacterium]